MAVLSDAELLAKTSPAAAPKKGLTDEELMAKTGGKPAEPEVSFPDDKPGTTYGSVLPFAKDEKTGDISLAAPEMIRAPVRGMVSMGKRAMGKIDPFEATTPDEASALLTVAGRPGPGAGATKAAGPAVAKAGAIAPERAALAKEAMETFKIPITGPMIGTNPTTKFAESAIRHLPFSGAGSEEAAIKSAFNSAVAKTFGEDAPAITQTVMDTAKKRIGGVMNEIEGAAVVNLSPAQGQRLAEIARDASRLPAAEWDAIKKHLKDAIRETTEVGGATFTRLFRHGSPLDRAVESDAANVAYYGAKIKSVLQDALQESLSPEVAEAYKTARFQYKNMKTIEPLVNKSPDGNISPALLNGRVTAAFPNRAYDTSGNPLDRLAKIGQAFLKEPGTSGTSERLATKAAVTKVGELGAAALAGNFIGIPATAAGAGIALGAGRLAGNYLRSPGLAKRTIEKGLAPPRAPKPPGDPSVMFILPPDGTDSALNSRSPAASALGGQ